MCVLGVGGVTKGMGEKKKKRQAFFFLVGNIIFYTEREFFLFIKNEIIFFRTWVVMMVVNKKNIANYATFGFNIFFFRTTIHISLFLLFFEK